MNPLAPALLVIQNPAEPLTRVEVELGTIGLAVALGLGFIQALHDEGMMNLDMPGVHVEQDGAPIAALAMGLHPAWEPKITDSGAVVKNDAVKPLRASCLGMQTFRPNIKDGEALMEEAPSWIYSWSDLL